MAVINNLEIFEELEVDVDNHNPNLFQIIANEYDKLAANIDGYPYLSKNDFEPIARRYFNYGRKDKFFTDTQYTESELNEKIDAWFHREVCAGSNLERSDVTYMEFMTHCRAFYIFGKYGLNI